jgi:hypothetical protein
MFDPHGWSEDSYYEALGNVPTFRLLMNSLSHSVIQMIHISLSPVSGHIQGADDSVLNKTNSIPGLLDS